MGGTRGRSLRLGAALGLFVLLLAARLGLHPNTPYKSFALSAAPVMALWLALGVWLGAHAQARRLRLVLALTAAISLAITALWCLMRRPDLLTPLPVGWAAAGLIGVWLVTLFAAALVRGGLNRWLRPGPMTGLAVAAIAYALTSGFLPLPFGPQAMTAGMVWLAIWQGVHLYRTPA